MRASLVGWSLVGVLAVIFLDLGCGSSSPPAIPDPGGPFHTDVPPNTSLDALTDAQFQELCGEVSAANQAYLTGGIGNENTCRIMGLDTKASLTDGGGADGGTFLSACQTAYDDCKQKATTYPPTACEVPGNGCAATVELLSACLNEIANTNPVAACVSVPTCAMAAATGSTAVDAGTPCTTGGGPSLPACDRLRQQCPSSPALSPY